MPDPFLPPDRAVDGEQACRDVEDSIRRIAAIVLHASALAERMDAPAVTDVPSRRARPDRVRALRAAAAAGEHAIRRIALAAMTDSAEQQAVARVPDMRSRSSVQPVT